MTKKLKQIASTPKKIATHIYIRRGRYCLVVGTIAGASYVRRLDSETMEEVYDFLKEKGLYDELFADVEPN